MSVDVIADLCFSRNAKIAAGAKCTTAIPNIAIRDEMPVIGVEKEKCRNWSKHAYVKIT